MSDPVVVERRPVTGGDVVVVRMHRPEVRNAMSSAMLVRLVEVLDDVAADEAVAGLLLTGSGEAFCAGADVKEQMEDGGVWRMELFTRFYEALTLFPLPTAAAIRGPAVGGGAEAAMACDLRVAEAGAHLRFPGASYGIPVGTARLVGQVGLGTAKDWVLSSRDVHVPEARAAGVIQRVADDGEAEAVAMGWLDRCSQRDRHTVVELKRLFHDGTGLPERVRVENEALRARVAGGALPHGDVDPPGTHRPPRR